MTDYRVWPATNGPNADAGDPASPINLGLIFQVSSTCWAKAIHFYRGALSVNGPVKGRIFLVNTQAVVSGTAVDFVLSGTGWQTANLVSPVQLTANTSYKVAIHSDDNYSGTGGYWATGAGVGGITNGPLTAPDAGGAPLGLGPIQQGSFRVTSDPDLYPNSYFNGGNYWVDVTVTDVDPGGTHTGTGTAPITLAATGSGTKRATGNGSAAVAFAASGVGAKVATGSGTATINLSTTRTGVHVGIGTGTAPLQLAATRAGVHRGTGTGTALLTLAAHGSGAERDLQLTVGPAAALWSVGDASSVWEVGEAGAT